MGGFRPWLRVSITWGVLKPYRCPGLSPGQLREAQEWSPGVDRLYHPLAGANVQSGLGTPAWVT